MDTNIKGTLDYYYKNEVSHKNYYKMPKTIFTDEFNTISLNAKVAYMFMLDRVGLSEKNNWVDEEGRVRIIFTQEQLSKMLGCSMKTVGRIFKELTSFYGKNDGLIELISQGRSKPYIIYVKKIKSCVKASNTKIVGETAQTVDISNNVEKYSTESTDNSCIVENYSNSYVENIKTHNSFENLCDDSAKGEKNFTLDKTNLPVVKGQNYNSQEDKITYHEQTNCPTSKNKNNNNKISNNDINQSFTQESEIKPSLIKIKKLKSTERMNDKIDSVQIVRRMYQNKELPYEYMLDYAKMEIVIKHLVDFDAMEYNYQNDYVDQFTFSVQKLFVNTLVNMLTCEKMMLKNRDIYSSKVYYLLCQFIKFSETDVVKPAYISIIDDVAIYSYTKATLTSEIRNPKHYMAACILDALNNGDIRIQSEINSLINADKY